MNRAGWYAPARRLKAGVRSCYRRLRALRIEAFDSYERMRVPAVDPSFGERVRSSDSFFSAALATNPDPVADAAAVLEGRLRVLSKTVDTATGGLDWHRDFFTGATWPRVPYPRILVGAGQGRDVFVPWEFSRLQFIPALVAAHRATGDSACVDCFRSIVDDWVDSNPYLVGVNWWAGMEIAIRAINLQLGTIYFDEYLGAAASRYHRVLWAHAEAIHRHDFRKIRGHRNNHFLIAAVGLLGISSMFRGARASRFYETARGHVVAEILRQFRPDGGNFESAIHYHQLSLEAALVGLGFIAVGGDVERRIPGPVRDRLGDAVGLVSDYMCAFGRSPQFGDSSDGRIVFFRDYFAWEPDDHGFIEDIARLALGEQASFRAAVRRPTYPDSGYGFHRNDLYGVCLCASPVAEAGHGGHNHCDKATLVVQVGGQPVLVDAGTFSYAAPEARHRHRGTRAHNAVVVDGLEQGEISESRVFGRPDHIEPRIERVAAGDGPAWRMTHDGYERTGAAGLVERTVRCRRQRLEIEEHIHGRGEHRVDIVWNLDPAIGARVAAGEIILHKDDEVLCRISVPDGFDAALEDGFHSPRYGVRTETTRVVMSRRAELPAAARIEIRFGERAA